MRFGNQSKLWLSLLLALALTLTAASAAAEGRRTRIVVSTPKPQATLGPDEMEELPSLQDMGSNGSSAFQSIFGGSGTAPADRYVDTSSMPVVIDRVNHPNQYRNFEFASGTELLKVVYPPIYDCDAALIMCGGHNVLIDCGDSAQVYDVVDMLNRMRVRRLDAVIISHPHHDHVDGFPVLADSVKIGALYVSFPRDFNGHSQRLYQKADASGIPIKFYVDGDIISIGSASLKTYLRVPLDGQTNASAVNNASAVMLLKWNGRTMLFTGDIEPVGQLTLVANVPVGSLVADILKYPHHGVNPVEMTFMNAVKPKLSIITNKARNTPAQEGLIWRGYPFINTRYGGLVCATDGNCWLIDRLISGWRID